jgi:ATP-dependent helicase IRC3
MTIALRDYQLECLENVINESKAGVNHQLINLPTGSGKTICMAAIAKSINKKTLLLAHREELITQAVDKFRLFWPEVKLGICMAERDEIHNQVVVGSVQSCSRPKRLERLKEQGFELLMIDEAHHSVSESYQNIIDILGFRNDPKRLLVGVTATPMRSDKMGLGNVFEKITFSRSIGTMIKAGYLSPVMGRRIITNFSFERIRTRNGDFDLTNLSEAVNTEERNNFIVRKFKEYSPERRGIAFCVDVKHCKDLADAFKAAGIVAEPVFGDMAILERKNVLEGLKSGKIQIVTSCGILTEGFDEPSVDLIIMARPTKSPGLYIQCVGRGLRLWPGKQNCFVMDFTDRGNNLDHVMTLSNTIPEAIQIKDTDEEGEQEVREIDRTPKINAIFSEDKEFDVLGSARFLWVDIGDNEWSLNDAENREIVIRPIENGYMADLYFPDGSSKKIVSSPLPLEYCSGVCEDFARRHLKVGFAETNASWMNTPAQATLGQREYLIKKGAYREGMTKAEAALEIRKIVALKNKQRRLLTREPITPMQKYFLSNHGVNVAQMTKFQAMQTIAKIKQTERGM